MSTPIELILASFDGEQAAEVALKQLKELQKDGVILIANAAVLVKHKDGRASFKETEDVRAPAGVVFGAIVGGLVGLLGGPAGVIVGAAAGAATGGLAAHEIDMGFSDKNLKDIEALLPNGSSAVVALVTLEWVDRVVDALNELDARLWRQALSDSLPASVTGPFSASATRIIEGAATPVADGPEAPVQDSAAPETSATAPIAPPSPGPEAPPAPPTTGAAPAITASEPGSQVK